MRLSGPALFVEPFVGQVRAIGSEVHVVTDIHEVGYDRWTYSTLNMGAPDGQA